ncbi:MAG: polysaccharide pyruvyl transferase CsaB [Clostridiales bacterium]
MKVLHLIGGGDVGGARIHVLSLVKELSKYIEVKIISFRYGIFYEEARSMGLNIEVVKTGTIITDVFKVIKIVNSGYELLHSHGSKANMVSVLAKPFIKAPSITTIHSDYKLDYLNNFFKTMSFGKINTIALRFINYYIAVSDDFKNMLIKRNFNIYNIFQIPNGMNFSNRNKSYSRENFLKKYSIEYIKDDIIVGILARLHPVKDVFTFLKAANIVIKKYPNVKFLIGGDGEEREMLEKTVREFRIEKNVFFLGFISEDPFEFMNALDINVLTSVSEGFPYTILEGAKFKKPTITSDVGGIKELIIHGNNGYLFKTGDFITLSEYMISFIDNNDLRDKLGQQLYNDAVEKFSLETMRDIQIDIYKKVLIAFRKTYKNKSLSKEKSKKNDFLISGYYGSGNIGDDALLSAIIYDIKKFKKNSKIAVLSRTPVETKKIYGVDSINRLHIFKLIKSMKNSKIFINGGGSLIQDIKSSRSLIYYLSTILLAKIMGLKVILYANGIGPINKAFNKKITKLILNNTNLITLRDTNSKDELDNLKITKPPIYITADPALSIIAADKKAVDKILEDEEIPFHKGIVGISIRRWNNLENYQFVIAQIVDYIYEKHNLIPLFIPMHFPDDYIISKKILFHTKNKGYILSKSYSASELIGLTSRLEFVIGMRLHALIFSASVFTPIIGIEYENKVKSFLNYIDLDKSCFAGHIEDIDEEKLKKIIDSIVLNRDDYVNELKSNIKILKLKALENAQLTIEELGYNWRTVNEKKIPVRH